MLNPVKAKSVTEYNLKPLSKILAEVFSAAEPEKPWDDEHAYNYLNHFFQKQPDLFFVAQDNEKTIGGICATVKPWRTGPRCLIEALFIDSQHQKQGIGKELMKKVLKTAMKKYDTVTVEGISFTDKNFRELNEKLGLQVDDQAVVVKGDCREILLRLKE